MKLFTAIVLGAASFVARAEGLAPCQLTSDKWLIYNPYTACVSGYLEVSGRELWDDIRSRQEPGVLAQVYGSVGLGHWISLNTRGGYSHLTGPDSLRPQEYQRVEQLYLQLGHPVVDIFYASVGRIDAAFGLNQDVFRLSLPSRAAHLWPTSVNGARVGMGPRESFRLEIGTNNTDQPDPITGQKRNEFSGRVIRTIDLMDGARLIASYSTSAAYDQRRLGFATLVHHEGNRTGLEWVRKTGQDLPYNWEQVFRLVHEQNQESWSWVLSMEEIPRDSYRISYGINKPLIFNLIGTASMHFQKEETLPSDHFILMLGLGYGRSWVWEEQNP